MLRFTSLIELTNELAVGDKVAWIGEHSIDGAGETAEPNTVTKITHQSEWIRVDGRGIQGGEYQYKAYQDGSTEAFHLLGDGAQYRGGVVMARITDSDERIPVKPVYDDVRGEEKGRVDH